MSEFPPAHESQSTRAVSSTRADPPAPTAGLTHTVLCLPCGYNLFGLPVTGRCPECGASVERATLLKPTIWWLGHRFWLWSGMGLLAALAPLAISISGFGAMLLAYFLFPDQVRFNLLRVETEEERELKRRFLAGPVLLGVWLPTMVILAIMWMMARSFVSVHLERPLADSRARFSVPADRLALLLLMSFTIAVGSSLVYVTAGTFGEREWNAVVYTSATLAYVVVILGAVQLNRIPLTLCELCEQSDRADRFRWYGYVLLAVTVVLLAYRALAELYEYGHRPILRDEDAIMITLSGSVIVLMATQAIWAIAMARLAGYVSSRRAF